MLIAEIRHNAELQVNLPPDNPMAIFGQDVATRKANEKAILRLNNLIISNNMDIISVGIPDAMRPPSSVYVNHVGFDPELDKDVFKYGKTDNFVQRQKEHKAKYPHSITVLVVRRVFPMT